MTEKKNDETPEDEFRSLTDSTVAAVVAPAEQDKEEVKVKPDAVTQVVKPMEEQRPPAVAPTTTALVPPPPPPPPPPVEDNTQQAPLPPSPLNVPAPA